MEEIWKSVKGYEGLYEVSNKGRVKSLERIIVRQKGSYLAKEKYLISFKDSHGYLLVALCKNGKPKHFPIHRLVATAFIDNPQNKPHVDHINTTTSDNRVENLRWCTPIENANNPITLRRVRVNGHSLETTKKNMKSRKEHEKYNAPKEVFQYTKDWCFVSKYESISEAETITGIGNIGAVTRGKRNFAGGYRWTTKMIEPQE